MKVSVEFFGIPRERVGEATALVDLPMPVATALDVVSQIAERFPNFGDCFRENRLAPSVTVSLNGDRFLESLEEQLADGDSLLIMSADAGG